MKEIIEHMKKKEKVDYLLDTCFLVNLFMSNHANKLIGFCNTHDVGISSFNLEEFEHIHHKFSGNENHHLRHFLKLNIVSCVTVDVSPGDHDSEKRFVSSFDPEILNVIPDASDAVLFVQALKIGADILTKDRHHIFTAAANNYLERYSISVFNEFPH